MNELAQMKPLTLARALDSRQSSSKDIDKQEHLALVQLITARTISVADQIKPAELAQLWTASMSTLKAAEEVGVLTTEEGIIRRLNFIAALLLKLPAPTVAQITNVNEVVDSGLRQIPVSIEDARDLAPIWRELEIAQIRTLRSAKNLLTPMLLIKRKLPNARLSGWEEVFPLLP
ncbi:hypothetical protein [Kineosporia babensis]|uniref:Uncharacterized protein n=1 Tax=Kineosporia babensis TaxID=499548 RepID=A0A9X1NCG1_9ACTN|nr:hypothetical protein [Kineosporia babensis]MCD5311145.1 hypothetical protein [Kineosporia babensis]